MKSRTTINELIFKGIILFSILTVVQGIDLFNNINKVWLAVISLVLFARMFTYSYTRTQYIMLFLTVIVHLFSLFLTDYPMDNVNMLFYFLLWILLYLYFSKSKKQIEDIMMKSGTYITLVLWIWTALVGISALIPSSYKNNYFLSFADSSFRLMPATLIVAALAMYMAISRNDRRYELFLVLPTYAGFMNQSRTYFGVYILCILMYLYMRFKSKKNFYYMLLPIMVIIIGLMTVTGIADKLRSTRYTEYSYYDFWATVTNGRTLFWRWDMEAFFALPLWKQLVGNGFNFVYDVNGANMARIWAHNDIINILMNFGYIGLVIYCWVYVLLLKAFFPKGNKVPTTVKLFFHGAVFINSMLNMSYTYMCATISYPLFLCVINEKYKNN